MSYTPTVWANGDTITAAKLNKLEQGVSEAGNAMIVECEYGTPYTLDRTFAEIHNALRAGVPVYIHTTLNAGADWQTQYDSRAYLFPVVYSFKYDQMYRVIATGETRNSVGGYGGVSIPAVFTFQVSSADSYPSFLRVAYPTPANCTTTTSPGW